MLIECAHECPVYNFRGDSERDQWWIFEDYVLSQVAYINLLMNSHCVGGCVVLLGRPFPPFYNLGGAARPCAQNSDLKSEKANSQRDMRHKEDNWNIWEKFERRHKSPLGHI